MNIRSNSYLFTLLFFIIACSSFGVSANSESNLGKSIDTQIISDVESSTDEPISSVNINQANASELSSLLSGIGLKKAESIVLWREQHGEFTQVEQLLEIKGIGSSILEKNRSKIRL